MSKKSRSISKKADRPFDPQVMREARKIAGAYRIILEREPGGFLGRAIELPHVLVHGGTANQCEKKAREALAVAVATLLELEQAPPRATNKRTAQVNVRLTAEEKVLLEDRARREGFKGISDYLRHLGLGSAHTLPAGTSAG